MSVDSHGNALAALRREFFTGRDAELEMLRELIQNDSRSVFVVWLHGIGGVGKSALLRQFTDELRAQGSVVRSVDMSCTEATPDAFAAALEGQGPLDEAHLLLIDSAELLGALERWLRDEFLPHTPTHLLVVISSRRPPEAQWRADPQWWRSLRSVRLSGMTDAQAVLFLRNRDVPDTSTAGIVRASHGLPFALSLFAEAREASEGNGGRITEEVLFASPNLAGELLNLLLREVPTPTRTGALYVLALARVTTEELVRRTLDVPAGEAEALFAWLHGLSFVDSTATGLVPHGLAREALLADLRWRDPETYERLFRRLHAHLAWRLTQRSGGRWEFGAGLTYLSRVSSAVRRAANWNGADRLRLRGARPEDLDSVLAAIEEEHGAAARSLAGQWWDVQPSAFVVAEDDRTTHISTFVAPCLDPEDATNLPHDPVAFAALSHVAERTASHRRTERLLLGRWSTGSAVATCSALTTLCATTPGLAVSWVCATQDQAELSQLLGLHDHRPGDTFTWVGSRSVSTFVQDWRSVPFVPWAEAAAVRLLAEEPSVEPATAPEPVTLTWPWPQFVSAVKHAYRHLLEPEQLAKNPLRRTRLVAFDEGPAALRRVLTETVAQLRAQHGHPQLADILELTYLSGPRSQQAAARRAGLSFSTYRRRLASSIEAAAMLLRERELYGPAVR
ncbi:AAA family ATPase [Streptomyces sp. SudanB66_2053]|uniref:AAA family ATPase n=1 Tax=Streptomyces sp. SudanB66_2053 TaxID=3035277 RepID=UPI003F54C87A